MKKLMKFSLVLAVVLATTATTYASTADFSLMVKEETGKTIRFSVDSFENIDLSIYDASDVLINTENLNANGTIERKYDLTSLPSGIYFLEADSKLKVARYEIRVTNNGATLSPKAVAEVYKPTLVNKNGLVTMSILNFNESPVDVKIYDTDGNEVYDGSFGGKVHFFKKFDLSAIPGNKYIFQISYNDHVFSEIVEAK